MRYRPEIDGLRAVAVMPVVLFHAGIAGFSGGFVGVDVFLVISGYLIAAIILEERRSGSFTLRSFYERRARRLLPALCVVLFACVPLAWLWLLPDALIEFGRSVAAALGFVSNVFFWRQTDYFAAEAFLKPLLHTWSLSLEAQFYLLFPLVLLMLLRLAGRHCTTWLVVLAGASLAAACLGAREAPIASFYLLPTRAFEFLAGAVVAIAMHRQGAAVALTVSRGLREIGGLVGLGLVAVAVAVFDRHEAFPSWRALLPVAGTVLVIGFASPATVAGAVLASRPLVGLGLISYGVYLWHYPLFAFARNRMLFEPGTGLFAALVCLSLLLAAATWFWIERPFRRRDRIPFPAAAAAVGACAAVLLTVSATGELTQGLQGRLAANGTPVWELTQRLRPEGGLGTMCWNGFTLAEECRTAENPEILIWGDSLAMHVVPAILASKPDAALIQLTLFGCAPVFAVAATGVEYDEGKARKCLSFNERVREWLASSSSVKTVVMSSTFAYHTYPGWEMISRDGRFSPSEDLVTVHLMATLRELAAMGLRPVIVAPPPAGREDVGSCLERAVFFGDALDLCDYTKGGAWLAARRILSGAEREFPVIWLDRALCTGERCSPVVHGALAIRDFGHLTREGAEAIGRAIDLYARIAGERP